MERALHDLLGALSSLRLWEEILRSCNENRVQRGEALAAIRGSTVEMTRIVYDMLDVARARSGRLQLANEPVAIDRIADGAIEEARSRGLAIDRESRRRCGYSVTRRASVRPSTACSPRWGR